jgi:hypothetical protein
MGFNPFKKARKFVSKIIPNEVKPFLPYLMATMPGGMGLSAGLQKFGGDAFLKAALTKGITDDEADLKDSLRTGIIAAAPKAISGGLGNFAAQSGPANILEAGDPGFFKQQLQLGAAKGASAINDLGALKTIGAQGATDFGIQQAEIAQEELEEYNRMLKEQGVGDKTARRAAIYDIFMSAGYEGDYVNEMLDGYGYADGGRIGFKSGDYVGSSNNETTEDEYDSYIKEIEIDGDKPMSFSSFKKMIASDYADGGRAGYRYGKSVQRTKRKQKAPPSTTGITSINIKAEAGDDEEAMTMADFIEAMKGDDGFDPENLNSMREGLEMFYGTPMMGNTEPVPMMRFKKGGKVKSKGGGMDASSSDFEEYITIMGDDGPIRIKKSDYESMPGMFVDTTTSLYGDSAKGRPVPDFKAKGGLMGLKMGGRPMEMDYRQGGFIPVGSKERADDVPARLSKNEFVMTADAVRAAGGGSVNKGAKRMYNLMNNLEAK